MTRNKIIPALGLAGALLLGTAAIASAHGHSPAMVQDHAATWPSGRPTPAHWHHGWGHRPNVGFGDEVVIAPTYVSGNQCRYFRVKWYETGRPYWRHRYLECRYG
jgi:hypothetical protein